MLAGERYREFLVPELAEHGYATDVPMRGLGIGRQLQWLSQQTGPSTTQKDVDRLYRALRRLEKGSDGKRMMSACTGQQPWPKGGIYFFFEPGELRANGSESRVVRVGTHGVSRGSKATLWNRLRTHRGTGDDCGNHRSSIFRLHVGAALANRDHRVTVASWGHGQIADAKTRRAEEELERAVSQHIGAMSVLWLSIGDEAGPASDRAYLERNLIGLLVGKFGPADPPSKGWLGQFSPDERIQRSGLWNLDFLKHPYSPDSIAVLDEYVSVTLGKTPQPLRSIAPRDWHNRERHGTSSDQLLLFRG